MPYGLSPDEKVQLYKDKASKALDEMHKAIDDGDYKLARHHKIVANVAIDEMVAVNELVEEADRQKKQ